MVEFSIVIVTYNSATEIANCLESITKYIYNYKIEVIVVDNSSSDQTTEIVLQQNLPDLKLVKNSENLGFSKGCNLGASICKGKYLYFCNPDSIILNDIFARAKLHFTDRSVGCLSPQILRNDGSEAAFAFKFPHSPFKIIQAFIREVFNKSDPYILQLNHFTKACIIQCDWVLGAAMFIPKNHFREVGGFDESFYLYFEDIDICKKLKNAGYKILADRHSLIKHKFFGSSKSFYKDYIQNIRIQSQLRYYEKYYGSFGRLLVKCLDQDGFLWRA